MMFKFVMLVSCLAMMVSAQLTASTRTYNVSSPVTNGPYVVGQILPCTYRLFLDVDSTSLHLQIVLKPEKQEQVAPPAAVPAAVATPTSSNGTATPTTNSTGSAATTPMTTGPIVITENADVSKTEASAKHEGNTTYYEHSINFKIPPTVIPGKYNVVFTDLSTNTDLTIPIEIRPAAPIPTSPLGTAQSSGGVLGVDGRSPSMFASAAVSSLERHTLWSVFGAILASFLSVLYTGQWL